jgi:hypothetical protein
MISNASGVRSTKASLRRQRGVTLTGMIMACIVLLLLALLAFRVVPVYIEYFIIQKQLKGLAEDPALKDARRADIVKAWYARANVDSITSLRGEDISIERQGTAWVLSADYSVKVPLVGHANLCFDFHPSTK